MKVVDDERFPGNGWLEDRLERFGLEETVAGVHGIVRGALANPMMVEPAEAFTELYQEAEPPTPREPGSAAGAGSEPPAADDEEFEEWALGLLGLWEDSVRALGTDSPLPCAFTASPGTLEGNLLLLEEAVDLADGFFRGFAVREIPRPSTSSGGHAAAQALYERLLAAARHLLALREDPALLAKEAGSEPAVQGRWVAAAVAALEEGMRELTFLSRQGERRSEPRSAPPAGTAPVKEKAKGKGRRGGPGKRN